MLTGPLLPYNTKEKMYAASLIWALAPKKKTTQCTCRDADISISSTQVHNAQGARVQQPVFMMRAFQEVYRRLHTPCQRALENPPSGGASEGKPSITAVFVRHRSAERASHRRNK